MSHKVLCIGRQFGSGGHEIACRVGEILGIRVYEKDILHLACTYGALSVSAMEDADEKATNPFLFRTVHEGNHHVTRGLPTSEVLFDLQSHEIRRLAAREDCIIVGRCGNYVLRDENVRLLSVFVSAPFPWRVQRKMLQEGLTQGRAERLIRKMDRQRSKYYQTYTGQVWGVPENWDMTIDTAQTEIPKAAELIAETFRNL